MWGNPRIYYLKLNRDMISYQGELGTVPITEEGFGAPDLSIRDKDKQYKDSYTEGPWLMKMKNGETKKMRKGQSRYALLYAAGGIPEHISYSTAPTPVGPWTYAGEIMPHSDTGSFTNHCGVADYKGHSYFFYHTGKLPGGGGFGRSVAVEEFKYNADGSFPTIMPTDEGVSPIGKLNPYKRVEAETMAWSVGVKTEQSDAAGVFVSDIHNGDYIKVREVDFDLSGAKSFKAMAASALQGGYIEVHLDSLAGKQIARLEILHTGGNEVWREFSTQLDEQVTGTHDLYFLFTGYKGCKLFNLDWWQFENSNTGK